MNRQTLLILSSLTLISCTNPTPHIVVNSDSSEVGQPALHAVHNNRLRELMGRMNGLMQERFLTEPELDAEHRKYAKQIFNTAQNLSQTIDVISATLPSLKLSAAEQTTFIALVTQLREQTQVLQAQTKQNHLGVISHTLEQIDATCTSCHALFRKQ